MQEDNPQITSSPNKNQNVANQTTYPDSLVTGGRLLKPISEDISNSRTPQTPAFINNTSTATAATQDKISTGAEAPTSNLPVTSSNVSTYALANDEATINSKIQLGNTPFLVGSQMKESKDSLPFGIYLVAIFSLLGFIGSFFDTTQSSILYTGMMLLYLLLGVGLFLRIEPIRKAMVWLSGALLILSVVSIFSLSTQSSNGKTNKSVSAGSVNQTTLTNEKQQSNTVQGAITLQQQIGQSQTFKYVQNGTAAVEAALVITYLTRSRVKEAFEQPIV